MNFLRELWNGIAAAWKQLSLSARVNIVMAAVAAVVVVLFVILSAARMPYVSLATDLETGQVSEITVILDEEGIPYQVTDRNKTILVPRDRRGPAHLLLAGRDISLGRKILPSFETLFADADFTTNQWLQDKKFVRALTSDLQSLLNAIEFIEFSYVLIREAESELFSAEEKPSEAVVTLEVTRRPSPSEIKAILHIISSAGGSSLDTNHITLTTTTGDALHLPAESEFASIANSKLEYVAELERERERLIRQSLSDIGVTGTVRVSADVDFRAITINARQVSAGVVVSTLEDKTEITSAESLPEGAPGVISNLATEGIASSGGTRTTEERTQEITNSEPSITETLTVTEPGDVRRFTVALIVQGDDWNVTTDEDGNELREYLGITDDLLENCTNIAEAAVAGAQQPPVIKVTDHPFDMQPAWRTAAIVGELGTMQAGTQMLQWGRIGGQVLLILLGFMVIRALLRRAIEAPGEVEEEEEVAEIPAATREDMRRQEVASEIARLAAQQPEMVAAMLRSWMSEEEE